MTTRAAGLTLLAALFSLPVMAQTIEWPKGHPCALPQSQRPSWCPQDTVPTSTPVPTQPAVQATPTPRATPPSGATPTPIDATATIKSATVTVTKVAVGAYRYDGTGQLVTREGIPVVGLCFEFADGTRLPCSGAIKR